MKEKDIIFHLNEEFQLNSCSNSKVYELENNVSKIIIKCKPMEGFVYKLHREQYSEKSFVVMEKTENGVEYLLDNAFLSKQGIFWLQLSATSADQQYVSNSVKLSVGRYINATEEPTPEQASEIDKLLVKAEVLSEKADTLETLEVEEIPRGIKVSYEDKSYDITSGISPIAEFDNIHNGHKLTITDAEGKKSINILNGEDYEITEADYDAIAEVAVEKIDLSEINTRLDTLDNETLDIYQKIEDFKEEQAEITDALVEKINAKADENFVIDEVNTLAGLYNRLAEDDEEQYKLISDLDLALDKKNDKLIEGTNIKIQHTINGDIISATGGGAGDVTKQYLQQNYYDKPFINAEIDQLATEIEDLNEKKANKEELSLLDGEVNEIKMLGWTVPKEFPLKNAIEDGVFIQRVGRVDLGDLAFYEQSSSTSRTVYATTSVRDIVDYTNGNIIPNLFVIGFTTVSQSATWVANNISRAVNSTAIYIITEKDKYSSANEFKSAMKGKMLYYELAETIEMRLDSKGNIENNVNDVQINGTSILNNKVANIPKATNTDLGTVMGWSTGGIIVGSDGSLRIYQAQDNDLINRNNDYRPIVSRNYDKAVRLALTDGKGAEWTDTEKESARSRLGIVTLTQEEYDLIEVKNESTIYVIVG